MTTFISKNQIRMHDTDMAGILYFPRQFRLVHDAVEDFFETNDLGLSLIFQQKDYLFVVVHAESDYIHPLKVGDKLEVTLTVETIGTTSFTCSFAIHKIDQNSLKILAGTAKTVHVAIDKASRTKIPLPEELKFILQRYSS